jgi:hypothetical protein
VLTVANFSKTLLSASSDGRGVRINSLAAPGTLIHQSQSLTTGYDEIWIYGANNSNSEVTTTILFGSTSNSDEIAVDIPANGGLYLIVPGLILNNSTSINAFADSIDAVSIFGFVNRMVP